MNSDRPIIGMFDSGIGGLSVLHEALKCLPEADFLYYADTDHVPYGTKSVDEIRTYTDAIIRFLTGQGAEAIVIACNTATSAAVSLMRERYEIPIIGMEPAVKPALLLTNEKNGLSEKNASRGERAASRVLVMATPLTLRESKLEALLEKYDAHHSVDKLPAEELVHFAEKGEFAEEKIIRYLQEITAPLTLSDYGAVVLGCTHFNYFLPQLRLVFPDGTCFTDGVKGTIRRLSDLTGLQLCSESLTAAKGESEHRSSARYFFSGREALDDKELARIKSLHEILEQVS